MSGDEILMPFYDLRILPVEAYGKTCEVGLKVRFRLEDVDTNQLRMKGQWFAMDDDPMFQEMNGMAGFFAES